MGFRIYFDIYYIICIKVCQYYLLSFRIPRDKKFEETILLNCFREHCISAPLLDGFSFHPYGEKNPNEYSLGFESGNLLLVEPT